MKENKTQISVGFFRRYFNYLTAKRYKQKLESQKTSFNLKWIRLGKITFLVSFWYAANYLTYTSRLNTDEMKQESSSLLIELTDYLRRNLDVVVYDSEKVLEDEKKIFGNSFKFLERELHGEVEKVIQKFIQSCDLKIPRENFIFVEITNMFSFEDFNEADVKTKSILRYKQIFTH